MRIAMTGASGLVGRILTEELHRAGHGVVPMVRKASQPGILWTPTEGVRDVAELQGIDAIVHLAGASIGEGRWTGERKRLLVSSRVDGTKAIARVATSVDNGPRVIVGASAIGYYGHRGDEVVDEGSRAGSGFLADLCEQWESAYDAARVGGIRVATIRTGIVLSKDGGALPKMLLPIKLGVGGKIGSGRQWMSWITPGDLAAVYRWALEDSTVSGPINAVAPQPLANVDFTRALGKKLHRPTIFPLPAAIARVLLGEMADELLLSSTRVRPGVLLDHGFPFAHPGLEQALDHVLA